MVRYAITRIVLALTLGATVLPVEASPLAQSPQPFSLHAWQTNSGALFLSLDSVAWPVVPDPIGGDELASIAIGDPSNTVDVDPRLAPPPTTRVVQASDGSLYVTTLGSRWNTGYLLLPDTIGDADLSAMTLGPELDGIVPLTLATDVLPEAQQPPAAAAQAPTAPAAPVGAPAATRSCDTWVVRLPPNGDTSVYLRDGPKAPCTLLDAGQTISSMGNWSGVCVVHNVGIPCEVYGINLKRDRTYRMDVTTTNHFGGSLGTSPAIQSSRWQQLNLSLLAPTAYILSVNEPPTPQGSTPRLSTRPTGLWTAEFWAWYPDGYSCVSNHDSLPQLPQVRGQNMCAFTILADTLYPIWVYGGYPGIGKVQYSLTVTQVS
jgi:hypothetical protein